MVIKQYSMLKEGFYMSVDRNMLTHEMLEEAMQCETAEDLIALAKTKGIEITKEEAEAYIEELSSVELEDGDLDNVAGGKAPGGGDKSLPPESRY